MHNNTNSNRATSLPYVVYQCPHISLAMEYVRDPFKFHMFYVLNFLIGKYPSDAEYMFVQCVCLYRSVGISICCSYVEWDNYE